MRSIAQKEINESNKVLGKLTDKQLEQYVSEGHKKQNRERASKGGVKTLRGKGYTEIQKKGNETAFEKGVGIHDKTNPNYTKWKSEAGKKGIETQMKEGIGIHTDAETRREWSRLGGLKLMEKWNVEKTCPYCGITTKGGGYNKWHGEKCKHKK